MHRLLFFACLLSCSLFAQNNRPLESVPLSQLVARVKTGDMVAAREAGDRALLGLVGSPCNPEQALAMYQAGLAGGASWAPARMALLLTWIPACRKGRKFGESLDLASAAPREDVLGGEVLHALVSGGKLGDDGLAKLLKGARAGDVVALAALAREVRHSSPLIGEVKGMLDRAPAAWFDYFRACWKAREFDKLFSFEWRGSDSDRNEAASSILGEHNLLLRRAQDKLVPPAFLAPVDDLRVMADIRRGAELGDRSCMVSVANRLRDGLDKLRWMSRLVLQCHELDAALWIAHYLIRAEARLTEDPDAGEAIRSAQEALRFSLEHGEEGIVELGAVALMDPKCPVNVFGFERADLARARQMFETLDSTKLSSLPIYAALLQATDMSPYSLSISRLRGLGQVDLLPRLLIPGLSSVFDATTLRLVPKTARTGRFDAAELDGYYARVERRSGGDGRSLAEARLILEARLEAATDKETKQIADHVQWSMLDLVCVYALAGDAESEKKGRHVLGLLDEIRWPEREVAAALNSMGRPDLAAKWSSPGSPHSVYRRVEVVVNDIERRWRDRKGEIEEAFEALDEVGEEQLSDIQRSLHRTVRLLAGDKKEPGDLLKKALEDLLSRRDSEQRDEVQGALAEFSSMFDGDVGHYWRAQTLLLLPAMPAAEKEEPAVAALLRYAVWQQKPWQRNDALVQSAEILWNSLRDADRASGVIDKLDRASLDERHSERVDMLVKDIARSNRLVGAQLPVRQWPRLGGGAEVDFNAFRGKVVVLQVWLGSGACSGMIPFLKDLGQNEAVQVVAIADLDHFGDAEVPERRQRMLELCKESGITFPVAESVGRDFFEEYGFNAFPMFVVLDRSGVIRGKVAGYGDAHKDKIRAIVSRLLGGR
jgi:hypothetical protein